MEFDFQKALVTGGAGFIGSHICEELVRAGVEVVALDNYSAGSPRNLAFLWDYDNFIAVDCDVTDAGCLARSFDGVDVVFHNAAAKKRVSGLDPRRDLDVNVKGTFNVLEQSRASGVKKFVHASTGSVYGEYSGGVQDEEYLLKPRSYYGVSKLAGEYYVQLYNREYGLDTSVLRYFHVYGTRQESNEFGGVVAIFIRNMINGETPVIFGDGTQERSFTWVKDVVKANLLVATSPEASGETYNCASGIQVTVQELCDRTIELFGKAGEVEPRHDRWLPGDQKRFNISNRKITELGMTFETDFFGRLNELVDEARRASPA